MDQDDLERIRDSNNAEFNVFRQLMLQIWQVPNSTTPTKGMEQRILLIYARLKRNYYQELHNVFIDPTHRCCSTKPND